MKYTDNTLNIMAAKTYRGIGNAWIHNNIKPNDCSETIVEKILQTQKNNSITVADFNAKKQDFENKILLLGENCDGVVALHDKHFPNCRGNVKAAERPTVLFYKGDITLLNSNNRNIAVIGLLNPDQQTEIDERHVVRKLVAKNIIIVSGLANGCDAIAHHETLCANGLTIAILPSPLNDIQPSANTQLARDIVDRGGLVITEYLAKPNSHRELISRYIERDRLQALYSDCVLLSASYAQNNQGNDSGSRHALGKAREYNLLRAVIYHPFHDNNEKYALNRQIINETPSPIIINPDLAVIDQTIESLLSCLCDRNTNSQTKDNEKPPKQDSLF